MNRLSGVPRIEYPSFKAEPLVGEYAFNLREAAVGLQEYPLTISNESFDSPRARSQDAPNICWLKLRRELAAAA